MASITTWVRLEPRPRDGALDESLQAQVRDPLWLLARQWQFGEFQGENTGSLVGADLVVEAGKVDRYYPGSWRPGAEGPQYDPNKMPLETLVEAEPRPQKASHDFRHAVRAGQMFLRLLKQASAGTYAADFIKSFALPGPGPEMDDDTRCFLRVMAGTVPDGVKLRAKLKFPADARLTSVLAGITEKPFSDIEAAGGQVRADFLKAAQTWLDWYDSMITQPSASPAWNDERMEYAFSLSAPYHPDQNNGRLELTAAEYPGGRLGWYAFDVHTHLGSEGKLAELPMINVLPTPIDFRGMSASRFWQFEEGQVDFGGLDTAPEDLGKMLFAEFALVFGNDFFYIPVTLPVGSISRVKTLTVRNTFGETIKIDSTSQVDAGPQETNLPPGRLFSLSPTQEIGGAAPDYMFLAPTLIQDIESPSIEEVLLLRDEMANMAWAVERLVLNPVGKAINRFEDYQIELQRDRDRREEEAAGSTAAATGPLTYHLFTPVPDYWNPMLLEGGSGHRRFRLMGLDDVRGALLAPYSENADLKLYEEEVMRSGIRLSRAYQYTRWADGSRHVWIGRQKQPGRGEGSSGLKFDVLQVS